MLPSLHLLQTALFACALSPAAAAPSWGFTDAALTIQPKGSGVGGGSKEQLSSDKPLSKALELGSSDTLKLTLTAQEGKSSKRPHQAYLSLTDLTSGLETSFPLSVKESGKGKVELTQKDIPTQLLASSKPLSAALILASFGDSKPYHSKAFDLTVKTDPDTVLPDLEVPLRYGKLPEIHHIFKPDPKSPPKVISLVFTVVVLAAIPILYIAWLSLGANFNHLGKAMSAAPVSHSLYFGSIVAMESIFFMYYTTWNLFQTLPVAAAAGVVILLSGSRALSEVQQRRLAGQR